jgi:hypothetical protein
MIQTVHEEEGLTYGKERIPDKKIIRTVSANMTAARCAAAAAAAADETSQNCCLRYDET